MSKHSLGLLLLVGTPVILFAQSPVRIAGIDEPPEMTGEPKTFPIPSNELRQFMNLMDKWHEHDLDKIKALRPELDAFIRQHTDYSDAYTLRAMGDLCYLKSKDYPPIFADMNRAIATHSPNKTKSMFDTSELYGVRSKVEYQMGQYREAMDDLESGVKQNYDKADGMFMSQGTKPQTADAFLWSKSDLDDLVQRFPRDYRTYLFRGLYLKHFVMFDEKSYQTVMQDFQKAASLNPRSSLPYYYIGDLYSSSSMFTKAAWASDAVKFDAMRKAVQQYTKAIAIDPRLIPAYKFRATWYLQLKQSRQAKSDYDKILELDPDDGGAYNDRALAKMDLKEYRSAIFDLDEAIGRLKDDAYLWMMYQNRGDCHAEVGEYRDAVSDLAKAIELQLGDQGFLFSIRQFRSLYPEYDAVSDETLLRKLNKLFWPNFEYDVLAKTLLGNKDSSILFLNELYEKRGDAYLKLNDYQKAANDFNRIYRAIPIYAESLERWRSLGATSTGDESLVDVKTMEFATSSPARLWLKTVAKSSSYSVQAYEVDCRSRRINQTSAIMYDSHDTVVNRSDVASGWQQVVPSTMGEQFYRGMCSANH